MPKIAYELKDFSGGTITNGDYSDIPDGAASYSLNISPTSKLGAAETIQNNKELMRGIPNITSMVVRDGIDPSHINLAVNIDSLFILIEDYKTDTMLGDFVQIAAAGQLFEDTNPANWYSHGTPEKKWAVIDTVVGYGYEISGSVAVSGKLDTEPWQVYAVAASVDVNENYLSDASVGHLLNDKLTGQFQSYNNKTFKHTFYATSSKSVIILQDGEDTAAETTTFTNPIEVQFAKGGYLWADLGQNLDLTETERGLFIGSSTSDPMVQHKQSDRDGDIFSYLVPSEARPPTAQNALSNIDQMVWVYDSIATKNKCMVMIYGTPKIWQLVQNTTTVGSIDYYEFTHSADYTAQKGLGGISSSADDDNLWAWDFEGFNVYQLAIPEESTTSQDWQLATTKEFAINLKDIPTDGWISAVAEGKCDPNKLYILFTRAGGLQEGDTVVGVIDTTTEGKVDVTPVYVIPTYAMVTAYKGHSWKTNWLGAHTDVNPTHAHNFYWTPESSAQPPVYKNGDHGDLSHYTAYGYVHDMCWVNTESDKVLIDVGEGGLCVTTQLGTNHDCVWFNADPLGATAYLEYSGWWRWAKQWPNWWPNPDDPDGYWSDSREAQIVIDNDFLVGVVPQDITKDDLSLKAWEMLLVPATGPDIVAHWNTAFELMIAVQQLGDEQFPPIDTQVGPHVGLDPKIDSGWAIVNMAQHIKALRNGDTWQTCQNNMAGFAQGSAMVNAIDNLISLVKTRYRTYKYYTVGDEDEDAKLVSVSIDPLTSSYTLGAFGTTENPTALTPYKPLRTAMVALMGSITTLKDYASAETVAVMNPAQIRHMPIDETFPTQKAFTQLQAYTDGSANSHFVGSLLDQGSIKVADAILTTSGASVLQKLNNSIFTWHNYHTEPIAPDTAGDINGIFSATVLDSETNETQEATEGWTLYKPDGTDILHYDGLNSDGNTGEGMMVTAYTGDLICKNFEYGIPATGTIQPIFDTGDIAIGLKITEPTTVVEVGGEPLFELNHTYLYNMSFLYDGYQEGPLMSTPVTVGPITDGDNDGIGFDYLDILVKVRNTNPRITHVQVYRKQEAAEKYRLVSSVALSTDWTQANPDDANQTSGSADMKMVTTLDLEIKDFGDTGISYEALTGLPETLRDTLVRYAESEAVGSYLFVANCRHPKIPDAQRMIFRSEPGKFSIFNWPVNFLGMPENIHTLQSYNNRLYAFSNRSMYRIDPYNLIMEQEYLGMGISGRNAVTTMDGVMYTANKNGVYKYGAGKFYKITQTIENKWEDIFRLFPSTKIMLAIDKKYNSILVLFDNAGTNSIDLAPTEALVYTVDKQKWDIWTLPPRIKAQCINENNELMICATSSDVVDFSDVGVPVNKNDEEVVNPFSLYVMHTGSTKTPLEWVTKELTLGQDNRRKKFKSVKIIGQDVYLHSVNIDGIKKVFKDTVADDTSGTEENFYQSWKLPSGVDNATGWSRVGKNIKIKVKSPEPIVETDPDVRSGGSAPVIYDEHEGDIAIPVLKNIGITYSKKSLK